MQKSYPASPIGYLSRVRMVLLSLILITIELSGRLFYRLGLTFGNDLFTKHVMLKFVYCVRRRPDVPIEAFRKYWLENHGPLVRKNAAALGAKRYVQSHTLDTELNVYAQQPRGTKPAYDGITEVWWSKAEDLVAALQTPEGQKANLTLAEDEARFCDLPNCSVFFTEEHTIFNEQS